MVLDDCATLTILKRKQAFVKEMGETLSQYIGHIASCEYKVFKNTKQGFYDEYLVIHFVGGGWLARRCNWNSCLAILQELAKYIEGGYYEEVDDIKALENDPDWVEI